MAAAEDTVAFDLRQIKLDPSPIYPKWVLEGNPVARNTLLSVSADGAASSYIWDCTAGRFNWYYPVEETIYVIEGGVVLKDASGARHRLSAGDSHVFHAGTHAEWHVEDYIRKFALIRVPLPRSVVFAKKVYGYLKQLLGGRGSAKAGLANARISRAS
jgi:uncharacterized protein